MSDYNLPISGSSNLFTAEIKLNDRVLTYEGYGVKRLHMDSNVTGSIVFDAFRLDRQNPVNIEFPILGKSLPCVFTVKAMLNISGPVRVCAIVNSYDAIPDPDYFNIVDLDVDGLPIYADTVTEASSIQLYKKPVINGNALSDRVLLKTLDNTPENRMLYKIQEPVENAEPDTSIPMGN